MYFSSEKLYWNIVLKYSCKEEQFSNLDHLGIPYDIKYLDHFK